MEPITLTTAALFLAPIFTEAGKTLAVESVKLALEKRQDIKDKIIDVFRPEFTSLNLNDTQSPEDVKALIEAQPELKTAIKKKVELNSDLLGELAKILSKQEGRTIHTHNYIEHIDTAHFN